MKKLSDAVHDIKGQPMFGILAKAQELERQGRSILHFEIGQPDFRTPQNIIDAAKKSIDVGDTKYVNSSGIRELKETLCGIVSDEFGYMPDVRQVLVSQANAVIYFLVRCVANRGDEIIIPDPGFATYYSVTSFTGTIPARVPLREENEFRMNPSDIRNAITDKTRLIIINSPQNPTGSVMTKEEIEEVAEIAEDHDLYLLSDETYSKLIYDGKHHSPSLRDECKERTILLNSFSKSYSMTGWRLGYAVGPQEVIEKMGLLLETIESCLPPFIQKAGIEAATGSQESVKRMKEEFMKRREIMVKGLNSIPGVSCITPGGAFYAFPNIKKTGMTSTEFADIMLEKAGVTMVPGNNFGAHGEGYVRLCYAASQETIIAGIERMREAIKNQLNIR